MLYCIIGISYLIRRFTGTQVIIHAPELGEEATTLRISSPACSMPRSLFAFPGFPARRIHVDGYKRDSS